jgi:hypothetical protein
MFHCGDVSSPNAGSIWNTDRRLAERPVPGAPKKNRRPSLPFYISEPVRPSEPEHLLLPANTIHEEEEDDDFCILSIRPEKMLAQEDCFQSARLEQRDPTTVLLLPDMYSSAIDHMMEDDDDQDISISPRLFRFGYGNRSRYEEVMDVSIEEEDDDECDDIFRPIDEELEGREILYPRRFSWATELRNSADSERV